MYEGQPIICKDVIEDNWLEYLGYIKKQADAEVERQRKRREALKDIDGDTSLGLEATVEKEPSEGGYGHRYYDMGISGFWSWYITNKIG